VPDDGGTTLPAKVNPPESADAIIAEKPVEPELRGGEVGFLRKASGRKADATGRAAGVHPRCSGCGSLITVAGMAGGIGILGGMRCTACGQAYCLNCHNFRVKGPFCPGCGKPGLSPLLA